MGEKQRPPEEIAAQAEPGVERAEKEKVERISAELKEAGQRLGEVDVLELTAAEINSLHTRIDLLYGVIEAFVGFKAIGYGMEMMDTHRMHQMAEKLTSGAIGLGIIGVGALLIYAAAINIFFRGATDFRKKLSDAGIKVKSYEKQIERERMAEVKRTERKKAAVEQVEELCQTLERIGTTGSLSEIHAAVREWGIRGVPAPYANMPKFVAKSERGMKREIRKYLYNGEWGIRAGDIGFGSEEQLSQRRSKAVGRIEDILRFYL